MSCSRRCWLSIRWYLKQQQLNSHSQRLVKLSSKMVKVCRKRLSILQWARYCLNFWRDVLLGFQSLKVRIRINKFSFVSQPEQIQLICYTHTYLVNCVFVDTTVKQWTSALSSGYDHQLTVANSRRGSQAAPPSVLHKFFMRWTNNDIRSCLIC